MAEVSLFHRTNMAAVTSCTNLFNINKIQYGDRFFVPKNNMAAVTCCRKLLNINKIQYGRRFFVSTNQYGGRDIMHKAIQY